MVATLLRIRFRVLGNTLASSPWQLVGFILGALGMAGMLLFAWTGLFFLGFTGPEVTGTVVTIAGALLLLGWAIGPVFVAGVDTTLDPAKLAPFPITTRQMMRALTAAGLTGVPGIATVAGTLGLLLVFIRWPAASAVALLCIPVGVLTCVVASRLVAALSSGMGGNRRTRELVGAVLFLVVLLAGPISIGIVELIEAGVSSSSDPLGRIQGVVGALSWTPLAAAWAVPGDVAVGAFLPAAAKFLIAVATLLVLWWLWRRALEAALTSPARARSARAKAGKLGWFGRMPTGPTGATWARAQTYWLHDGRYLRQLLVVPIFPALMIFYSGGSTSNPLLWFSGVMVAYILAAVSYVDVSYDGTAFAGVLATGIRGRADRAGRILAAGAIGVPLFLAVAVLTLAIAGEWRLLPAVTGAGLGLLLAGYGVCAISSALLVVPVAAPGSSPFARVPGSGAITTLAMLAVWVIVAVLGSPALVLAFLAAATGEALYGWLALVVGVLLGSAVLVAGTVIGGRIFDRNAPALLARLRTFKTS